VHWSSDPYGARRQTKDIAISRFRIALRDARATDDEIEAASAALRVALAEVTMEEYPTAREYREAVDEVAQRVLARWLEGGRP
jgi:hypothetical protein